LRYFNEVTIFERINFYQKEELILEYFGGISAFMTFKLLSACGVSDGSVGGE
jgi:hypothetical protein